MPGNAVMIAGDWIYDESARQVYDCDALEHKKDLDTFERQVLNAVNMAISRRNIPS